VTGQAGSNPGLQALWEDERQRRLERQLSCDLEPPPSPGPFRYCALTVHCTLVVSDITRLQPLTLLLIAHLVTDITDIAHF